MGWEFNLMATKAKKAKPKFVLAWFCPPYNMRLSYGDNRAIKKGGTHTVKGKIVCCYNGLHASLRIADALRYGETRKIIRVRLSGTIRHQCDKLAAESRTYLSAPVDIDKIQKIMGATNEAFMKEEAFKSILADYGKEIKKWFPALHQTLVARKMPSLSQISEINDIFNPDLHWPELVDNLYYKNYENIVGDDAEEYLPTEKAALAYIKHNKL